MAAIYMWFEDGVQYLTTTLYPIEVSDSLQLECNFYSGDLRDIESDSYVQSAGLLAIVLNQILIDYGPDNEDYSQSSSLTSIVLNQILIEYGPDNQDYAESSNLLSIVMNLKLVTVDTPDEKLQLNCDIEPSDCSMTDI